MPVSFASSQDRAQLAARGEPFALRDRRATDDHEGVGRRAVGVEPAQSPRRSARRRGTPTASLLGIERRTATERIAGDERSASLRRRAARPRASSLERARSPRGAHRDRLARVGGAIEDDVAALQISVSTRFAPRSPLAACNAAIASRLAAPTLTPRSSATKVVAMALFFRAAWLRSTAPPSRRASRPPARGRPRRAAPRYERSGARTWRWRRAAPLPDRR